MIMRKLYALILHAVSIAFPSDSNLLFFVHRPLSIILWRFMNGFSRC